MTAAQFWGLFFGMQAAGYAAHGDYWWHLIYVVTAVSAFYLMEHVQQQSEGATNARR